RIAVGWTRRNRVRFTATSSGALTTGLLARAQTDPEKAQHIDRVALPEPARLGAKPVEPLQPQTPHPLRRARRALREEVEQRTHPHVQGGRQLSGVIDHPALLQWIAERHQHKVGSRLANL